MSPAQIKSFQAYWWPDACRAMNWDARNRDFRLRTVSEWLGRFIGSITEVVDEKEIDLVKSKCLALSRNTDLKAQENQVKMARTRILWRIKKLCAEVGPTNFAGMPCGSPYLGKIMRDRHLDFDMDVHDEKVLTELRNTLNRAVHAKRRKAKETVPAEDDRNPF